MTLVVVIFPYPEEVEHLQIKVVGDSCNLTQQQNLGNHNLFIDQCFLPFQQLVEIVKSKTHMLSLANSDIKHCVAPHPSPLPATFWICSLSCHLVIITYPVTALLSCSITRKGQLKIHLATEHFLKLSKNSTELIGQRHIYERWNPVVLLEVAIKQSHELSGKCWVVFRRWIDEATKVEV